MNTVVEITWSNIKQIQTLQDVKDLFAAMNEAYWLTWDPDEDFEDYSLPKNEGKKLQKLIDASWEFCKNQGLDIYDIAMEVNLSLRKEVGFGTDCLVA